MLSRRAFCKNIRIDELDGIQIDHPKFRATLMLQGAQLIQFYNKSADQELLWLSPDAEFKMAQSIRGGIPICWPWFGNLDKNPAKIQQQMASTADDLTAINSSAQAHGFARSVEWRLKSIEEHCQRVVITLSLNSNDYPNMNWPFKCEVDATFVFSDDVSLELTTHNTDNNELAITQALHTYLPTENIQNTHVFGLENSTYIDALLNWREKKQTGAVRFNSETDRLYFANKTIRAVTPQATTLIDSAHSASCVVWNPWIDKSQRLSQFPDNGYLSMFCIETANVMHDMKTIAPGSKDSMTLRLHLA